MSDDFATAIRAFGLMPLRAQERVLEKFAKLQYPKVVDRFHEAVYQVVVELRPAGEPVEES